MSSKLGRMAETVFYSWQADLPNATNRGLIERALDRATAVLRADNSLDVDPVVDRDTAGEPGAPDISETILAKIDAAVAIVSDVSIVTPAGASRPSPNPNVVFELGYAVRSLGWERIVLVMNTAFGRPEDLPFDLRSKRVLTYSAPADTEGDRASERRALESRLTEALRLILEAVPAATPAAPSIIDEAQAAIESQSPQRTRKLRLALDDLLGRIDAIAPDMNAHREDESGTLVSALGATGPILTDYLALAESLAAAWFPEATASLLRFFSALADRFHPRGPGISYRDADFDFQKFLAHELFTSTVALLLRDSRWDVIADLLARPVVIDNGWARERGPQGFGVLSEYASLLDDRREAGALSRFDILKARHESGGPGATVPLDELADADYLLFLRGELEKPDGSQEHFFRWRPWTWRALWGRTPRFLHDAHARTVATQLASALGVSSVEILRKLLHERVRRLSELAGFSVGHHRLDDYDFDQLGRR